MSVLRDYELWSLAKLNVELMSSGTTGYPARNANSAKGIFEMNFTHKIDIIFIIMFTGRLGLGVGPGPWTRLGLGSNCK